MTKGVAFVPPHAAPRSAAHCSLTIRATSTGNAQTPANAPNASRMRTPIPDGAGLGDLSGEGHWGRPNRQQAGRRRADKAPGRGVSLVALVYG